MSMRKLRYLDTLVVLVVSVAFVIPLLAVFASRQGTVLWMQQHHVILDSMGLLSCLVLSAWLACDETTNRLSIVRTEPYASSDEDD
jgi:hypothetical protein